MSEYKRLTNKNLDEYYPELDFCVGCEYFGEPNGCNRWNGTCRNYDRFIEMFYRLAELEDKIESGRLVELPCKVGDTIYYVEYFCNYKGCSTDTQTYCCGCKEMIERERKHEKYVIAEKKFSLTDLSKIGKKYLLTKESAEARLKELQEGKDESYKKM